MALHFKIAIVNINCEISLLMSALGKRLKVLKLNFFNDDHQVDRVFSGET